MLVKVIKEFRDKDTKIACYLDDIKEYGDERAKVLIDAGYVVKLTKDEKKEQNTAVAETKPEIPK